MDIVNINKVPKKPLVTPLFTGEEVTAQSLLAAEDHGYTMSVINIVSDKRTTPPAGAAVHHESLAKSSRSK